MNVSGPNNEFIQLLSFHGDEEFIFDRELKLPLIFIWTLDESTHVVFEDVDVHVGANTVLCLTEFHRIQFKQVKNARLIKFNREFYCVLEHDVEVSCKGILFYGAEQLPLFQIPPKELETFEMLWKMFESEMRTTDPMQLAMLQVLLKRMIILCTRIYKQENRYSELRVQDVDVLRDFHYLVEQHFRAKHTVQEYAEMLNKSPKTLSNLFSKISDNTPLQIIHNRKLLEAKRLLRYTDKSIKEIAYELGFEDIQTFSRFFKKSEQVSPSEFRNQVTGIIANMSGNLP